MGFDYEPNGVSASLGSAYAYMGAARYVGPLDIIPGAAGGYSVARKLRGAYAGALIRIRRASDNTEADFGALQNGALDTASVATFLSATTGFLVTIYDQSENARDMTQATTANQPGYTASSIGSRPAGSYDGTNDRLVNTALGTLFSGSDKPLSVLAVANPTSFAAVRIVFGLGNSASNNAIHEVDFNTTPTFRAFRRDDATASKLIDSGTPVAGTPYVLRHTFSGLVGNLFQNGVRVGSANTDMDVGTCTFDRAAIGALERLTPGLFFLGAIPEVIVYPSEISATAAQLIERNQGTYYGITVA